MSSPARPSEVDRRTVLQLAIAFLTASVVNANADEEYSTYKGPISLGYTFEYPSSWNVKKKPIKTHLSEVIVTDENDASTTAGLVVDSVKIPSIDSFGTPEQVGQKVLNVETKKESVNSATLTSAQSVKKEGLTYYVVDYTVDSTRGVKRYLAKATITGSQLYVFTAQAKADNYEGETQNVFSHMLDSFHVAEQYL